MKLKLLTLLVLAIIFQNPVNPLRLTSDLMRKGQEVTVIMIDGSTTVSCTFSLEEKIGYGSFGTVYKAITKKIQQNKFCDKLPTAVALKIQIIISGCSIKLVQKENRVLEVLKGLKSVPELYMTNIREISFIKSGTRQYLYQITELMDMSLKQFIEKYYGEKTFSVQRLDIVKKAFKALESIHSKNILHYDLKTGNIMISIDCKGGITLKIIDFGLSTTLIKQEWVETFETSYFPPEVISAKKDKKGYLQADKSMDVYMMGLSILNMFVDPNSRSFLYEIDKTRLLKYFVENKCKFTEKENEIINLLLNKAIKDNPKERLSATSLTSEIKNIVLKGNITNNREITI